MRAILESCRFQVGLLIVLCFAGCLSTARAETRVHPTGVNVSGHGATTVFLTFAPLEGFVPAEALWCGELVQTVEGGAKCDPSTIYGVLPARYDRSIRSGIDAFTDIMSIPVSVIRRAYEAAAAGEPAAFFYVRRFINPSGGFDRYVPVTCRLTGGGARVPLSLVDVRLAFDVDTPVLQVKTGDYVSPLTAHIQYTGTGRLKGRWEVVLPGQEAPSEQDLLTEAALPAENRSIQRRYAEIERFNIFLPPVGRVTLKGPEPARLPTGSAGQYLILLRIEASDDKEADSDLTLVGAGRDVIHSGAVAGFPMPVLRYVVGSGGTELSPAVARSLEELSPSDGAVFTPGDIVDLRWPAVAGALYYRLEFEAGAQIIHSALVAVKSPVYRVPPFVLQKSTSGQLAWRVFAVDSAGRARAQGTWRRFTVQRQVSRQ